MTQPFVSVIIPVKNDAIRLRLCLEALSNQTYLGDYEVVVGDNGSTDHPERVIREFPHARLVLEPENGSYAARNAAVNDAKGSIFAFTDSDCIPSPEWLEQGLRALQECGDEGFVGGQVILFALNPLRPTAAELWDMRQGFHQRKYIEKENFAATANVFVTRKAFDRAGRFSQTLISSGDREWGNRATENGVIPHYSAEAVVKHPARYQLSDLRNKSIRLLKGDRQLRLLRGKPLLTTRELVIGIAPPIPTLVRNLPLVEPPTLRNKSAYTFALLYVTYTNLLDKISLYARNGGPGDKPRKSTQ